MSYIRIVSKRKGGVKAQPGEMVIGINRYSGGCLKNPIPLADPNNDKARDRVLAEHQALLDADVAARGPMSEELDRIAEIVASGTPVAFECFCAPKKCHGENHRRYIELKLGRSLSPPDDVAATPAMAAQTSLF